MTASNIPGLTCLVTGTTHGIGMEIAQLIASQGNTVLMLNRNTHRANLVQDRIRKITGNSNVYSLQCDLASIESVRQCADIIRHGRNSIDVLINNAGVMSGKRKLSPDGIELTLAVNFLGPFLLTQLLADMLLASPHGRIVNMASSVHIFGRINASSRGLLADGNPDTSAYSGMRAYADSKLAMVMYTLQFAARYQDTTISANCLHPGVVATNLLPADKPLLRWAGQVVKGFMRTPQQSAHASAHLALSPDLNGVSGKYFSAGRKIVEPSAKAKNTRAQQRLWETAVRRVGAT